MKVRELMEALSRMPDDADFEVQHAGDTRRRCMMVPDRLEVFNWRRVVLRLKYADAVDSNTAVEMDRTLHGAPALLVPPKGSSYARGESSGPDEEQAWWGA